MVNALNILFSSKFSEKVESPLKNSGCRLSSRLKILGLGDILVTWILRSCVNILLHSRILWHSSIEGDEHRRIQSMPKWESYITSTRPKQQGKEQSNDQWTM